METAILKFTPEQVIILADALRTFKQCSHPLSRPAIQEMLDEVMNQLRDENEDHPKIPN